MRELYLIRLKEYLYNNVFERHMLHKHISRVAGEHSYVFWNDLAGAHGVTCSTMANWFHRRLPSHSMCVRIIQWTIKTVEKRI